MIYHDDIQVSAQETSLSSGVVAEVERGSKLATDQLCGGLVCVRAQRQTHRHSRHTFVSSFPSRLCAKLAPMV